MTWGGYDPWKEQLKAERQGLRVAAYEAPCEECGAVFTTEHAERRTCGATCRSARWRRNHPDRPYPGRPAAKHIAPEWLT